MAVTVVVYRYSCIGLSEPDRRNTRDRYHRRPCYNLRPVWAHPRFQSSGRKSTVTVQVVEEGKRKGLFGHGQKGTTSHLGTVLCTSENITSIVTSRSARLDGDLAWDVDIRTQCTGSWRIAEIFTNINVGVTER